MNYVNNLNICGTDIKEIPCIKGTGAPTTTTEGAVGLLYMDISTEEGTLYKCTAVNGGVCIWEPVVSDSSGESVDISGLATITNQAKGFSTVGKADIDVEFENGTIQDETNILISNQARMRFKDYVDVEGIIVDYRLPDNISMYFWEFKEDQTFNAYRGWYTGQGILTPLSGTKYIKMTFKRSDNATMTAGDLDGFTLTLTSWLAWKHNDDLNRKLLQLNYKPLNRVVRPLSLIHFSDIHGDSENIDRIVRFKEAYNDKIDEIIHTGDSVMTYFSDANPFAKYDHGNSVINIIGNHDCWITGEDWYNATAAQVYAKFISPYVSNWGVVQPAGASTNGYCYFYKDYAECNIRLVFLDCMHYDSVQETWFSNVLSDAKTNGYTVAAVIHYSPQNGVTKINCPFSTITNVLASKNGDRVERFPDSACNVVDDFINNGGDFACWIGGHTHWDYIGYASGHENQLVVIVQHGSTSLTATGSGDCEMIRGTSTQDCFNVMSIDSSEKLIRIARIGLNYDKWMRYKNTICINYDTKEVIN